MTCQQNLADVRGRLESEDLVGEDIHDPLELCRRLEGQVDWVPFQGPDWKPLVQETLHSPSISVLIRVGEPAVTEAQVRRGSSIMRISVSPKETLLVHLISTPRIFPASGRQCPYRPPNTSDLKIRVSYQHLTHILRTLSKLGHIETARPRHLHVNPHLVFSQLLRLHRALLPPSWHSLHFNRPIHAAHHQHHKSRGKASRRPAMLCCHRECLPRHPLLPR